MSALHAVLLVGWAVAGTVVVLVRDPLRQTVVAGIMGLVVALAFFSLNAPDVALSELVVSSVALPVMVLLALAKVREQDEARRADEESDE